MSDSPRGPRSLRSIESVTCGLLVLLGSTAALVVTACSSIPEVVFEDRDASVEDAGDQTDGGSDALEGDYACPSRPPPRELGICCSVAGTSQLCLNCDSNDCARCFVEGCSGTTSSGKVCCRKNSVRVTCDEAADCL